MSTRVSVGPSILLRGVVKCYQRGSERVEVLHHIDLQAEEGEFLALMGPSGSGKTTILNLLAGLDKADEGDVVVLGERIASLSRRQLSRWRSTNVGFVFQFYNLLSTLSAERNVEVPLFLTGLTPEQRRRSVTA